MDDRWMDGWMDGSVRHVPCRTAPRVCDCAWFIPDLLSILTNPPPGRARSHPWRWGLPRSSARGSPTRPPAAPQRPAWGLPRSVVGAPTPPDWPQHGRRVWALWRRHYRPRTIAVTPYRRHRMPSRATRCREGFPPV